MNRILLLALLASQTALAQYSGPIFDAHAHIPRGVSPSSIRDIYQRAGVSEAALFVKSVRQGEYESTKEALGKSFYLFADAHSRKQGYEIRTKKLKQMKRLASQGELAGIGELYWGLSYAPFAPSGISADLEDPVEEELLEIAAETKIPVQIHDEFLKNRAKSLIKRHPQVTFILAHAGYLPPDKLGPLLDENPNLYAELSLISNRYFGPFKNRPPVQAPLTDAWKTLFESYPDRFLVGSDIGANQDRISKLPDIIEDLREVLGELTPATAEKIGYLNARALIAKR